MQTIQWSWIQLKGFPMFVPFLFFCHYSLWKSNPLSQYIFFACGQLSILFFHQHLHWKIEFGPWNRESDRMTPKRVRVCYLHPPKKMVSMLQFMSLKVRTNLLLIIFNKIELWNCLHIQNAQSILGKKIACLNMDDCVCLFLWSLFWFCSSWFLLTHLNNNTFLNNNLCVFKKLANKGNSSSQFILFPYG